jgi:nitric oxide reductase NorD protein
VTTVAQTDSELTRFYALFPYPDLARDLFNIVEGHRIDHRLRAAYPGIRRDMDGIRASMEDERPGLEALPEAAAVVEALLQRALGRDTDLSQLAPSLAALIERTFLLLEDVAREEAGVDDAARATAAIYELIDDALSARGRAGATTPGQPQVGDPGPQGDRPDQDPAAGEVRPPSVGAGLDDYESAEMPPFMTPIMEELVRQRPELAKQDPNATGERPDVEQQQPPDPEDADGAMGTSQVEVGAEQRAGDEVAQATAGQLDEVPAGSANADARTDDAEGGSDSPDQTGLGEVPQIAPEGAEDEDLGEHAFPYDEWDFRIEDYRPAWCTLREQRATRTQEGFVAATFHEYGGIVTQIRRNFQLMRPERLRKMRFQMEGDDLDTDGLVEYVVDRRARVTPSGRVYIKRDKKDRDVTTAFLVDMSSSTDRKIDGRKRVMDIEKESLLLMCEALEAIRDEYAIYGFSGNGREDCEFYVIKEIGERYDDRVKARIGGIYARQKTRMGPAIRHTTRRLAAADSHIKLMILLTDGKPYDTDTYQDNQYAQEDTKMALREARREKIHLFCVTVDSEGADYLPNMYSDANFVVVDDVRTLPQRLPQLYRRLTT